MKDKALKKVEEQMTTNLPPLEIELMNFVELVQSTRQFFDLKFLRVVKKGGDAYFEYMGIVKKFPLEYIDNPK